jgi:hypothetical protein
VAIIGATLAKLQESWALVPAAIAGVAEHQIARQSRHRSMAVLHGHVRDADLFWRNADSV